MKAPSLFNFVCLASFAGLLGSNAWAQQVWRCGEAANIYSDKACVQGQQMDVSDRRSPAEVSSALQQLKRQQSLAGQMTQQRQAEELSLQRQSAVAANLGPSQGASKNKLRATKKQGSTSSAKQPTRRLTPQKQPYRVQPQRQSPHQLAAPETWPAAEPASRRNQG